MKRANTTKKNPPKAKILSNIHPPSHLSLKEWQIALRKQAAAKETFVISETDPDHCPGEYLVWNYATGRTYETEYHGPESCLNSCSCMDFRTSRIGTCKHIEAVKNWIAKKNLPVQPENPALTTVYMDYSDTLSVKIHFGTENRKEIESLAEPFFDQTGKLCKPLQFNDFLESVRSRTDFLVCRADVLSYLASVTDRFRRNQMLDELFKDEAWWEPLFVKGITPYNYQKEGIAFAARAGRCILADEMGLGKTIQAIGTAELLFREGFIGSVLVICPTSLKYQWKNEIKNFCGCEAVVIEGDHTKRKVLYNNAIRYKIVSYNAIANDLKILGGLATDMVIMDEVQRLKNWNTQIAKGARKIRSDYAVILSGTPLENKLEELYSIVQLVDQYALGPYYAFRQNHILTDETGKVLGYQNLNEVGEMLKPLLLRRRKADVALQLPERIDNNQFVPMTQAQMDMHDEFGNGVARIVHKWRTLHYLSDVDRKRLLLLLSKMRMVCDSTFILDQKSRDDTKVEETMHILDSIFSSPENKVVIFSQWERMTRLIAQELDKIGIRYCYLFGGVPSAKRKDLIDDFFNEPEVKVFLSTDAGGTGLNLQAASFIINLDLPWNPAVLEQRIGRIYRIGQRNNIQVINLVSARTIEEQMLTKLKFKSSLFAGVLDNGEDTIYLDDSKLKQIVDNFDFKEPEQPEANIIPGLLAEDAEPIGEEESAVDELEDEADALDIPAAALSAASPDTAPAEVPAPDNTAEAPAEALVSQGVAFFENLLTTLKNPSSAEKLINSLVVEDKATGQASLNIPVKSKDSVLQIASLLGKLLK